MKIFRAGDCLLNGVKTIHMIGIGGSGMGPLAELLLQQGFAVQGSDVKENEQIARLRSLGAAVKLGQAAENINGADLVAYSAAVLPDNPERAAAAAKNLPMMERSELLGAMTRRFGNVIGVCGTHGKTTVSSMITQILHFNKMQPNAVIGGKLKTVDSACVTGDSDILVCESCEYVDSFLQFSPDKTVLLNIDNDHMEYFRTMENMEQSFRRFVEMGSVCYANGDDVRVRRVTAELPQPVITFGFRAENDFRAVNLAAGAYGFSFTVQKNGLPVGQLSLRVPGRHNVLNALAAFAVCTDCGVCAAGIADALATFTGAGRRFEFLGTCNGAIVADDFAHHPTEMKATLQAARDLNYKRIVVAFQPYTFSRVAIHAKAMAEALSLADRVFLTPIVAAREVNTYGVDAADIADKIPGARVVTEKAALVSAMRAEAADGVLLLTMGAGDIFKVAQMLAEEGQ